MSHNLIKVGLESSLSITCAQENWNAVLASLLICTNSQRRTQIDFPFMLHLICHSPITPKWVRASINKALSFSLRLWTGTQWRGNDLMLGQLLFCMETMSFPTTCFLTWSPRIIQKGLERKLSMEFFLRKHCVLYINTSYVRGFALLACSRFKQ